MEENHVKTMNGMLLVQTTLQNYIYVKHSFRFKYFMDPEKVADYISYKHCQYWTTQKF